MTLDDFLAEIDQRVDYAHVAACKEPLKNNAETCPDCLHQQYFSGQPIDYTCDQTRLVYILRFLPVHMQENLSILHGLHAAHVQITQGKPIKVLAVGGGPGSEIAALRKFVNDSNYFGHEVSEIHVVRLDRMDRWTDLHAKVRNLYESDTVTFKYFSITGDVTACVDYEGGYDLVFLSYILSELSDAQTCDLANKLRSLLKSRAVLVLNDRNEVPVVQRMNTVVSKFTVLSRHDDYSEKHLGLSYPDDIRKRAKAKLQMKSYRLGVVVEK